MAGGAPAPLVSTPSTSQIDSVGNPKASYVSILKGPSFLEETPQIDTPQELPTIEFKSAKSYQGKPLIEFTEEETKHLVGKLQNVLIGKFSHGRPPISEIKGFFSKLKLKGTVNCSIFDNKHIYIECSNHQDYARIWLNLNWTIKGCKMRVFKWDTNFCPKLESAIVPVWVRIENLPLFMFDEIPLLQLANIVGKPLKIDKRNINRSVLNTARICVELDLSKPLVDSIWVKFEKSIAEVRAKVFYDELPQFCTHCSHLGHLAEVCKLGSVISPNDLPKEDKEHKGKEVVLEDISDVLTEDSRASVVANTFFKKHGKEHSIWQPIVQKKKIADIASTSMQHTHQIAAVHTKNIAEKGRKEQDVGASVTSHNQFAALSRDTNMTQLNQAEGSSETNKKQDKPKEQMVVQNLESEGAVPQARKGMECNAISALANQNQYEDSNKANDQIENVRELISDQIGHKEIAVYDTQLVVHHNPSQAYLSSAGSEKLAAEALIVEDSQTDGTKLTENILPPTELVAVQTVAVQTVAAEEMQIVEYKTPIHSTLECQSRPLAKQKQYDQELVQNTHHLTPEVQKTVMALVADSSQTKEVQKEAVDAELVATQQPLHHPVLEQKLSIIANPVGDLSYNSPDIDPTQGWQVVSKKPNKARGVVTRSQMKVAKETWADQVEEEQNTTKAQTKKAKKLLERQICKLSSRLNNMGSKHVMRGQLEAELETLLNELSFMC